MTGAVASKVQKSTAGWENKLNAVYRAINTNDKVNIQQKEFQAAFKDATMAEHIWEQFKDESGTALDELKTTLAFKRHIGEMGEVKAASTVDNWAKRYLKAKTFRSALSSPTAEIESNSPTFVSRIVNFFAGFDGEFSGSTGFTAIAA